MAKDYSAAHANPQGPGDARPTALQIIEDQALAGRMTDKIMMITGCSTGIGVETARALAVTGAKVYMTVRDMVRGQEVLDQLVSAQPSCQGKLHLLKMELDSLQSVRECAAEFLRRETQLHVLVANAGIMACPEGTTQDGFEKQFGTNHLGHFLLFNLLKPALLAASSPGFHSRVVALSSVAHRRHALVFDDLDLKREGYDPWKAYGRSKTANVYMALEIERLYGSQGLHAWAVHPGGILTELSRHLDAATQAAILKTADNSAIKSVAQGAATSVWAAVAAELEGQGGKYLEDCSVSGPVQPGATVMQPGHGPHAYDGEAAQQLWAISCKLTGLPVQ